MAAQLRSRGTLAVIRFLRRSITVHSVQCRLQDLVLLVFNEYDELQGEFQHAH